MQAYSVFKHAFPFALMRSLKKFSTLSVFNDWVNFT